MIYGGFWRRFAALMIDGLILLIPSALIHFILPFVGGILLGFFYTPFFDSSETMGTPGKVLMGLKVATEAGTRLSFKEAFLRYCLMFVSGLFLGFGYFMNLFTEKRQTFHDIMAGAVVIRRPEMNGADWIGAWTKQFKSVFNLPDAGAPASPSSSPSSPANSASAMATLESLHKLYQAGAISEAEYNEKKNELLKKI